VDPVVHYLHHGGFEGRNPGPCFDSAFYLACYPDVRTSGLNPLVHFILHGKKEGRLSQPEMSLTQTPAYKEGFPDNNFPVKPELNPYDNGNISGDLYLISQSGLFDADYYLRSNEDIRASSVNPMEHFYFQGWREGRSPSQAFDTQYYLAANEDVRVLGINPLVHYINSGKAEGRLPKAFEFKEELCLNMSDISDLGKTELAQTDLKIAVVCHLFYPEMAVEFIRYFKNITFPFDLYITTTHLHEESVRALFAMEFPDIETMVLAINNRGRDIAPFIALLKPHLMQYDLVCKVHSKRSGHNLNLQGWRTFLLDQLLGNSLIINRIVTEFVQNPQLGMIWPVAYPYIVYLGLDTGWGPLPSSDNNFRAASVFFSELQLEELQQDFVFPLGSMFWFRPKALALIVEKNIEIHHFEDEENQTDGTLAHALERLLGVISRRAGFETRTVFFPQK